MIKTQRELQATAGRVLLGSSAGWMSLHSSRMDTRMAEAHVSQASCQHKPAGVFGVTKSELSPCK